MIMAVVSLVLFTLLCPISGEAQESEDWTSKISVNSDFRLRGEYIELENSPVRNRQRLRARLGAAYKVNDQVTGQLSLTTAENNDPVSMNQTMGDSASYKAISIYEAYALWKPADAATVLLGKALPVFHTVGKSELIWDHDLRTEGIGLEYKMKTESAEYGANIAGYSFAERSADDDTQLFGGQIFGSYSPNEEWNVEAYVGSYQYSHLYGKTVLRGAAGNSVTGAGATATYDNNYNLFDAGLGLTYSGLGLPVTLFYQQVQNTQADTDETGWIAGLNVGKIKEAGDFSFRYNYRVIEADAVVGTFTDSDFIGGGTNGSGSEYGIDYGLGKNAQVNFTFFDNKVPESSPNLDYRRAQLDFVFKM